MKDYHERAQTYDTEAWWYENYGQYVKHDHPDIREPERRLTDEEFMFVIDEGRRRLGNMRRVFETASKEWGKLRCSVCARPEDPRCTYEC